MVDLVFLHNKETTRVRTFNLDNSKKTDLAKLAKQDASDSETEALGLSYEKPDMNEDDQDLQYDDDSTLRVDKVLDDMSEFPNITGKESDVNAEDLLDEADYLYLLNFQDKLGRTALHYACFYGSVGVVEDLMFLKANPWIEDVLGQRPIDLIQSGAKYDVLVEMLTNNMKITKDPKTKKIGGKSSVKENMSTLSNAGAKKKKGLKSLEIKDLKLVPDSRLESERIGIMIDNYLGFAIANKNYPAVKYLLSTQLLPIDFKNSAGNTYFHTAIIQDSFDLLKLLFVSPILLSEEYSSKSEIDEFVYDSLNPEIYSKKVFELTSNKQNTILNC